MTALQYKMNARRALTGKKSFARGSLAKLGLLDDTGAPVEPPLATLSFRSEHYAVGEDQQSVIVMVNCFRCDACPSLCINAACGSILHSCGWRLQSVRMALLRRVATKC